MDQPTATLGLDRIRATPLGKLKAADVDRVTRRIVAVHTDQARIAAAKFSSAI